MESGGSGFPPHRSSSRTKPHGLHRVDAVVHHDGHAEANNKTSAPRLETVQLQHDSRLESVVHIGPRIEAVVHHGPMSHSLRGAARETMDNELPADIDERWTQVRKAQVFSYIYCAQKGVMSFGEIGRNKQLQF